MKLIQQLKLRPGQYHLVICDRCQGHGKHDHPAFSNGFTSDEWERMDYEERDDYLSGVYDVQCEECSGAGRLAEPLPGRLDFGQLRELARLRRRQRWHAEAVAEQRREMQMLGEW